MSIIVAKFGNQKTGTCLEHALNLSTTPPFETTTINNLRSNFVVGVAKWHGTGIVLCSKIVPKTGSSTPTRFSWDCRWNSKLKPDKVCKIQNRDIRTVLCQAEHGLDMGLNSWTWA